MATTALSRPALQPRGFAETRSKRRSKTPLSRALATALVTVLAVVWLVPFAWAAVTALKSETGSINSHQLDTGLRIHPRCLCESTAERQYPHVDA